METAASAHGLKSRQGADLVVGKFLRKANRARTGGATRYSSIASAARVLCESVPASGGEIISELQERGILVGTMSTKGLLILLKDFGLCDEVDLYTASLERIASRERFLACEEVYFIGNNEVDELKVILEEIRSAPGLVGLANFRVVEGKFPLLPKAKLSFMKQLIFGMPHAWTSAAGADLWFMFEDRRNAMISYLKRVHYVTDSCSIRELSETLRDALDERSEPDGRPYPSVEVIELYLRQSGFVDVRFDRVSFTSALSKKELRPAQACAWRFLLAAKGGRSSRGLLETHLLSQGHSPFTEPKTISNSPIIHVEKAGGLGHYSYRLIGFDSSEQRSPEHEDLRYAEFRELLRRIEKRGTDEPAQAKRRREQAILKKWLFGECAEAECALCGRVFAVGALVTAHKKPRRLCCEAERLDPHIVMPVCLFGCDFLYERGYIYVQDGKVRVNRDVQATAGIRAYTVNFEENLRSLNPRWIQGPEAYFRRPVGSA